MASVATSYIRIVADFTRFRSDAVSQAIRAGDEAARAFRTSFRTTMRDMFRRPLTFNVQPVLDLTAFRAQYRIFRHVYLQDQSFLVNPQLNDQALRLAFLGMQRTATNAGQRAGNNAGTGFNKAFILKVLAGAAAAAFLQKALAGVVPILGQIVVAAGAVGAALPALITTMISLAAVLKLSFQGVGEAIKQAFAADDPEALAEALKKLSPAAQGFVLELAKYRPQLKAFQQAVQQEFFTPMLGGFTNLMRSPALNVLKTAFKDIAKDAGVAGRGVLDVVAASAKSGQLADIFVPIRRSLEGLLQTVPGLVQTFLTLGQEGSHFAEILVNAVSSGLKDFIALIARAAADGTLAEFFRTGIDILRKFGALFADIGSIILSVFKGITAGGGDVLGLVGQLADQFATFLKSVEGQEALKSIGQVLSTIGGVIRAVVTPLLPVVARLVTVLGGPLVKAIETLTPTISMLVQTLADLLLPIIDSLSPVIDVLVQVLADFLAEALTEVSLHIQRMAPFIQQLASELGPHLTPIVLAFGETLMAVVPLIPMISEAMVELMPLVIDLIPLFVGLTEAWLVSVKVGTILVQWIVTAIGWFVEFETTIAKVVLRAAKMLFDFFVKVRVEVFQPLIDWIQTKVPAAFRYGVDVIEFWWKRLQDVAKVPVRFVIDTVVNKGIIGTFNKIAGFLPGVDKLNEIPLPPGFAQGGHFNGRLPGQPSNVDNMLASTPWGPIALAGGEYVVKAKEANRPMAKQVLEWINDGGLQGFADGGLIQAFMNPVGWVKDQVGNVADRIPGGGTLAQVGKGMANKLIDGLVSFLKSKLTFGGDGGSGMWLPWPAGHPGTGLTPYADSGVWRNIVALIQSTGPLSGSFGNAYRAGDPLWHGAGRAVDWMGFNQDALASLFMGPLRPRVLELIHRSNSRDYAVTRGRDRGSFSNGLMEEHRNHIHIAMAKGGQVGRVMDTGGWMMPGWNPPTFNGTGSAEAVVPEGMAVALTGNTIRQIGEAFARAMSTGLASARHTSRAYS